MAWFKSKLPLLILLFVFACTMVSHKKSFIMPGVETHEEEKFVLMAVPVIPVEIEVIE